MGKSLDVPAQQRAQQWRILAERKDSYGLCLIERMMRPRVDIRHINPTSSHFLSGPVSFVDAGICPVCVDGSGDGMVDAERMDLATMAMR